MRGYNRVIDCRFHPKQETRTPMILSFYCDDTNPYDAPPEALKIFLDFTASEGIAGEASVILGYQWAGHGLLSRPATKEQEVFLEQAQRAFDCGIDTHFELMTHNGLFDFAGLREPAGAIHEGLWLYEPAVSQAEYEAYFENIIAEGGRAGVRYTGLTWPGCGCPACSQRYQELHRQGITEPNPGVWQALLSLAQRGRFRGKTVPCFFGGALEHSSARLRAAGGGCAIYELAPNAEDYLALWLNDPAYASADYYISADGQSGRMIDLFRRGEPYCLFYAHWQGLNPLNGAGWAAFTEVVKRVQKHLKDQAIWMRPSACAASLNT